MHTLQLTLKNITGRLRFLQFGILISFFSLHAGAQDIKSYYIQGVEAKTALSDYLEYVEKHSSYRIFYSSNKLNSLFITPDDNGELLIEYLEDVLLKQDLSLIIYRDKNLVIVDRSQLSIQDQLLMNSTKNTSTDVVVNIGSPLLAGKYKKAQIHGFVRNGATGDPLPGSVIHVPELDIGVITDSKGYYAIELPVGEHTIQISFVGFENEETHINLIAPGSLDVELFENTVDLDQVVVLHNARRNYMSTEMSVIRLDAKMINSIPVLMGEPDLIKSMTLMPGIQTTGDMASGFNVRGGSSDQNLITLDGVPIYNSNHLFGMFSVIDAQSIDKLELHKGIVAARYGGRISSFMDIKLREGNMKEFEGNASLGIFNSKLAIQGPIIKNRISYAINGRTTYSDWLLKRIPQEELQESSANFYDWNAKLHFVITPKLRMNLVGYQSKDDSNLGGDAIYEYTNQLASVQLKYLFNDKLSFSLNGFSSQFTGETSEMNDPVAAITIKSGIEQLGGTFRTRIELAKHSFESGIEHSDYSIRPGSQTPFNSKSLIVAYDLENEYARDLALYVQDEYKINRRLSVNAGVRYNIFTSLGPATVNSYSTPRDELSHATLTGTNSYAQNEIIKQYKGFEPRFGIRYIVGVSSSMKAGYSRTQQNLHILANNLVVIPTDTWKTSDTFIKPAISDQISLGYFQNLKNNEYETSAEVYYRLASDVLEFKPGASLVMNPEIEQDVLSADLEAYGIEVLFRKNVGKLNGWVSYTFSRSFMQTLGSNKNELINRGARYISNYDKPHDVSIVSNYAITRRLIAGASFIYSTGRPVTYPENFIMVSGNPIVVYSDRNKYRLPDYHRLDLSLTYNVSLKKNKKFKSSWVLSVINVYGRNNIYSTYYRKNYTSGSTNSQRYINYRMAIIGVPIPSLTYNLTF